MSPHRMSWALTAIVHLLLTVPSYGQSEVHEQFWPEANVFIRTSHATRVFLLAGATRDKLDGPVDAQFGAHVDLGLPPFVRELFTEYDNEATPLQFLLLRGGIRYFASTSTEGSNSSEWRGLLELTARETLFGTVLAAWRNRQEFRWVNGEYSWRWRSRLWVERTLFVTDAITIAPYLSTEMFYDSRAGAFNRNRSMAGFRVGVLPWLAPEMNVGYQRDWELRDSKTYFLSGILNFYF